MLLVLINDADRFKWRPRGHAKGCKIWYEQWFLHCAIGPMEATSLSTGHDLLLILLTLAKVFMNDRATLLLLFLSMAKARLPLST
jgi:hypothetical protein